MMLDSAIVMILAVGIMNHGPYGRTLYREFASWNFWGRTNPPKSHQKHKYLVQQSIGLYYSSDHAGIGHGWGLLGAVEQLSTARTL